MKFLGLALLAGCALGIGQLHCRQIRQSLLQNEGVFEMLGYIRESIRRFLMPLDDIFSQWKGRIDSGAFDRCVREGGIDYAMKEAGENLLIPPDMKELLSRFSERLGRGDGEGQIALCDLTIEQAGQILERQRKEAQTSIQVTQTLSASGAILAALIFL